MVYPKKEELNSSSCTERSIKKHYPEFYEMLVGKWPNLSHSERLYWFYSGIESIPLCKECGKPVKFINWKKGYSEFCCNKCVNLSKIVKERRIKTNIEKYGENYKEVLYKKSVDCVREKYGVENVFESDEIKEKIRESNRKKLGVDYPMQSKDVRNKSKKTCLDKYGVEYFSQSDISIELKKNDIVSVGKMLNTKKNNYLINHDDIIDMDSIYFICKCNNQKCDKCIENIILLGELIEQLTKEANFLNIERFNAISDERIEALYQRKREKLYKISLKASSELNVLYNKLCNREAMLKPKIDKEFASWLQEKDKQTTKYNELLSFYNYQRANFANTDFKKLERQINDLHNFITENYLDPRAAYIEITNDILDEDDMYQDIKEKYEEISLAFDEADLNYKNYCSTPEIHKRHIKEPIEKDYEQKLKQLRNLILNKKRRKEYFEKVLENTQKKQEHLVSTYGNEFGKDSGRKR